MGEFKDAANEEGVVRQTHIGGQALIEGIMMRGRYNWAVAVREPDGNIYTEQHDLASGKKKNSWMYWPIIRGCTALVESLALGYKALEISGNHAYDFSEDDDPEGATASDGGKEEAACVEVSESASTARAAKTAEGDSSEDESTDGISHGAMVLSMTVGLLLGIVIFIVAPAVVTNLIMGDYGEKTFLWNLTDGLLRVAIFVLYIWAISLMKDIRRMFCYHGAEHKTIHCYEHDEPLTPENAMKYPRLHVRCGTAFMLMTMIIAILVFTIVPVNSIIVAMGVTSSVVKLLLVIASRIILLPLVAGLAYEVTVKWAGSHPENPFVRIVLWPGLQLQKLTTNPPDESMLECAIAAMNLVLEREREELESSNAPSDYAKTPCQVVEDEVEPCA